MASSAALSVGISACASASSPTIVARNMDAKKRWYLVSVGVRSGAAPPPQTSAALSSLDRRLNTEVNELALATLQASSHEAQFLAHDLLAPPHRGTRGRNDR